MKNFNSALILFLFLLGCTSCQDSSSSGFSFSDLYLDKMIMKIVKENMKEKDSGLTMKVWMNFDYLNRKNHKQYYLDLSAEFKKLYSESKEIDLNIVEQKIQIKENRLIVNGLEFDALFNKKTMKNPNKELLKKLHIHFLLLLTGHNYDMVYIPKQGVLNKPVFHIMKKFTYRDRENQMQALLMSLNQSQNQDYKSIYDYKICKLFQFDDYGTDLSNLVSNNKLDDFTSTFTEGLPLMTNAFSNRAKVALCCKTIDSCVIVGMLRENGPELMTNILDSSEYELIRL